jgi:hypothetical protein
MVWALDLDEFTWLGELVLGDFALSMQKNGSLPNGLPKGSTHVC